MSKDIWHTADVKPKSLRTFVYKTDKGYIGTSKLAIDSGWNPVLLPEFYSMDDFDKAERIIKWCYLDDLFALETENKDLSDKIGKLQSKLDIAVDALKRANNTYCAEEEDITIDLTESAAHKWQRTAYQMEMPISIALEQITAKQKDK